MADQRETLALQIGGAADLGDILDQDVGRVPGAGEWKIPGEDIADNGFGARRPVSVTESCRPAPFGQRR
jgi:hypothetical protein